MADKRKKREKRTRTFTFVNLAFQCSQFKGVTRLVLLSLADRADISGVCWCAYEDIMLRTNASRGAIAEALNQLTACEIEGKHLLKRQNRFRDGKAIANIYTLSREALEALAYKQEVVAA